MVIHVMKNYARIADGRIAEIIPETIVVDGIEMPLSSRYHPDFLATLTPLDEAQIAPPQPAQGRTLPELIADLQAAATARRWAVETGGVTLPNGSAIATGVNDQARIESVITGMETEGFPDVPFKAASGWVTLTLADMKSIRSAIAQHVRACFVAERQHHQRISALQTIADAQSYDVTVGWPH